MSKYKLVPNNLRGAVSTISRLHNSEVAHAQLMQATYTEDLVKSQLSTSSESEPEDFVRDIDQCYIPFYAFNVRLGTYNFKDRPDGNPDSSFETKLESIYYPKVTKDVILSIIPKSVDRVLKIFFSIDRVGVHKVEFVFNNQPNIFYVGPGVLFDSEGKILACLAINKQILNYLNELFKTAESDLSFLTLCTQELFNLSKQSSIVNTYGSLLVTNEFYTKRENKNLLRALYSNLIDGEYYKVDLTICNNIESKIFNSGTITTTNMGSVRERTEFQKRVWREMLT